MREMSFLLQPLSRHKCISCLDVYCHSSPFTLLHPFPQAVQERKKKKPVTLLKLSASPVAGVYPTEDVFPLQIKSQLHNSVGYNKTKSPLSKNVPGCLGISWKSPAYHSTEISRELRENTMKVDANLPFPASAHLHQPHRRACSCPRIPPAITYPFLEDFKWLKAHTIPLKSYSGPSPFIPPKLQFQTGSQKHKIPFFFWKLPVNTK